MVHQLENRNSDMQRKILDFCTAITNTRVNGQRKGRSVAGEKEGKVVLGGGGRKGGEGDKNLE
jgi:hypothetical protein